MDEHSKVAQTGLMLRLCRRIACSKTLWRLSDSSTYYAKFRHSRWLQTDAEIIELAAPLGGGRSVSPRRKRGFADRLLQTPRQCFFKPEDTVVLFNTGSGLKYLDVIEGYKKALRRPSRHIGGIIGPY